MGNLSNGHCSQHLHLFKKLPKVFTLIVQNKEALLCWMVKDQGHPFNAMAGCIDLCK